MKGGRVRASPTAVAATRIMRSARVKARQVGLAFVGILPAERRHREGATDDIAESVRIVVVIVPPHRASSQADVPLVAIVHTIDVSGPRSREGAAPRPWR